MKFLIKSFIIYLSSFHALVSAKESNKIEISVDAQMVEFGDPRSLLVELYGYNNLWADTSATIIRSSKIPVKSLPATISFDVMENPHLLIKSPSVEDPAQARYYFRVSVDADQDGKICKGDLVTKGHRSYQQIPKLIDIVLIKQKFDCL